MTNRIIKYFSLLALSIVLAGCKLVVMVSSGGDVTSFSGTRNCAGGSLCEFEITESSFTETFTATARPGFEFERWNSGGGFVCADPASPDCVVSLPPEPFASAIVAGFDTGYIMPFFKNVGIDTDGDGVRNELDDDDDNDGLLDEDDPCPFNPDTACGAGADLIFVNDKIWYQPDLFLGVTWEEISSVCPLYDVCDGVVNGYNLTGWTWANVGAIANLFDSYAGLYPDEECPVTYSLLANGWRATDSSPLEFHGWMMPLAPEGNYGSYRATFDGNSCGHTYHYDSNPSSTKGAFFYFPPGP